MAPALRYFELRPHVAPGQPFQGVNLPHGIPTAGPDGSLGARHALMRIRPAEQLGDLPARAIPETRIVEARPLAAGLLAQAPLIFQEVDPPSARALKAARDETHDARQTRKED